MDDVGCMCMDVQFWKSLRDHLDELRVLLSERDLGEWDKLDEMHVSASTFLFNANL